MILRSLLFVPADRPERFAKAVDSGADAIILDLEDSVATERKGYGRGAIAEWLAVERTKPVFVRVNPLDGGEVKEDLDAVLDHHPDGLLLPKAEGAASIEALLRLSDGRPLPLVLPIATETPGAVFELGSYRSVAQYLMGITWGAEDLPAAIGASTSREADGSYTAPYEMVRALSLFAAHASHVQAIETVFPTIDASAALSAYIARARRDGFSGMMAIHPRQVALINAGFTPSADEIEHAHIIVAAFAANPGVGALKLDGKMIDQPHLTQAKRILDMAGLR